MKSRSGVGNGLGKTECKAEVRIIHSWPEFLVNPDSIHQYRTDQGNSEFWKLFEFCVLVLKLLNRGRKGIISMHMEENGDFYVGSI